MRHSSGRLITLLTSAVSAACADRAPPPPAPTAAEHRAAVEDWSAGRIASLRQPIGWLSLAGLYWIEPGRSTFGADPSSRFAFDVSGRTIPGHIGTFVAADSAVTFEPAPDAPVESDTGALTSAILMDGGDSSPVLRTGALEWRVIRRGDRLAVRLWDTLSATRSTFTGIDRFPITLAWRLPARFIVTDPPDTIDVPNVLGTVNRTPSPGRVEFEHAGETFTLMTWKDSDDPANFFTAFADATSGALTYGGGRFLWIDAPDANGWTVVDFNRSYNPPCVFTDYATCPLAPRPNRLPFAIEAGEKTWSAVAGPR
jgi:hypothetical protein